MQGRLDTPSGRVILALETSCDETAAAVLRGFGDVLGSEVYSQAAIHSAFGGVVPEVASRNHLALLPSTVERVLSSSGLPLHSIDAVAATTGPGLAAALLVGASAAKGLAIGLGRPFIPVNHIVGHMLSPFFGCERIPPHVALVVSGGHTLLFDVAGAGAYTLLGRTLDDAAGEALDKAAKLLGLGYPGGAEIDRLARGGDPEKHVFPRAMMDSNDHNFSFSGLKTSLRRHLERSASPGDLADVCASFQQAVVDVLVSKLLKAAEETGRTLVGVSGGVSANTALVSAVRQRASQAGIDARFASPELRTDNALMIAFAAAHSAAGTEPLLTDITPNFDAALVCR